VAQRLPEPLAQGQPILINDLLTRVPDQEWIKRTGLTSYAAYPLVLEDQLVGLMAIFAQHSLAFVDKGSAEITGSDAELQSAFVVGNGVAYAVWDGLRKYSAGTWSTVADTGWGMLTVWADAQTLIACGYNQTILVKNGSGDLTQLTGVPAGIYTAVWAFAADDVWFGNGASQLLHYDGKKWKIFIRSSKILWVL